MLLKEKDFIHEDFLKNPFPALISFFIVLGIAVLFWFGTNWYYSFMQHQLETHPFLRVTNRDFSIFLWQFPEYMRANVKKKAGYLIGFQYEDRVTPIIGELDSYVVAPPELIFLYHTWDRLLKPEFSGGKIAEGEFIEFLLYCEEWLPRNWAAAPEGYVELVNGIDFEKSKGSDRDLSILPPEQLPVDVRMAFQGWHNYFKDYSAINALRPSYAQLTQFFRNHPHYERSYWRNIVMEYNPNYLISYSNSNKESAEEIPVRELAPFLRVGIYNYLNSNELKNGR